MPKLFRAIGLMSGTSMDGIDVALVETDGEERVEFGPTLAVPYGAEVRKRIEQGLEDAQPMATRSDRPGGLAALETEITDLHAQAVGQFLSIHGIDPQSIDLLGFHGQTVLHRPEAGITVQLGDGEALARTTGIDTVHDMRATDMTVGGQGAPLVPVFHRALAKRLPERPVAFVNIGGISNVTWVGEVGPPVAFDCGPGMALIDRWVQSEAGIPFDDGGRIAGEGTVIATIVDRYLASEFFDAPAPKSLDRLDFPPLEAGSAELSDGARSLARITAEAIARAIPHMPTPPKRWLICGGGRLHSLVMADLREVLAPATVEPCDAAGFDGDMMEAQAFAYLAVRSARGLPLTFPTTTGCREAMTGGVLARAG
ncbi:anhydro-N-acetylmuramic acid kinase [Rhizobiaceae bacterium]|nr:anhydro-N-acetylmuramic acid kinase [Rhizobiaceae bacterium]